MQVSIEAVGTLGRRITVEVPEERVRGEMVQRLANLSRKLRVDGFRVGKVPMKVVEQRYGAELRREVIGDLMRSSLEQVIRERDFQPAGDPTIEPVALEPGQGLVFHATFEVYPKLVLSPVEVLCIHKPLCEVTAADIDQAIEALRHRLRDWEEVERPAEPGDCVELDYQGHLDGRPLEGASATGAKIDLGSTGLPPGLAEALVGVHAGAERSVDLDYPGDNPSPSVAGKTVRYEMKVHKVLKPVLPPIDEALAARCGVQEGGVEGLRTAMRGELERQRDREVQAVLKREVLQALVTANPFELPKVAVEHEVRRLEPQGSNALPTEIRGPAEQDPRFREVVEAEARKRVALGLIIGEIVRLGGLRAEPAAVRATVTAIAKGYADPEAVVKWYYEDRRRLVPITALVLEDAALAWVLARARVEERRVTFDALCDPRQTGFPGDPGPAHAHW